MKPQIAEMWVAALHSDRFEQGKGALADSTRAKHCCMGVLCELAIQNGISVEVGLTSDGEMAYGGKTAFPPREVRKWAGLRTKNAQIHGASEDSLTLMNDKGFSFAEIADIIKEKADEI